MAECPIPTLASELTQFLSSPEKIAVHSFQSAQRFWPGSSNDYNSLFKVVPSPLHSDLCLLRDSSSGLCHGYCEEELDEVGLTAKNSSSLNRSPVQPGLSVKGEPTNYPFWPGGFDSPAAEVAEKHSSFTSENLLTQAPGLSNGMTFAAKNITKDGGLISNIDLSEMLFGEGAITNLMAPSEESRIPASQQNDLKQSDDLISESHQQLEEVLTDAAVTSSSGVAGEAVGEEKWATAVDCGIPLDHVEYTAHKFPFILDPFQKHAISHLEKHENVFVAAHTSAGKTVVAEYAIALSRDHHTKVIYTSPIKALSNQKFREFRLKFGEESVGLITGDVQLKTEAPCLIMTTEILRSMLYNGSDVIRDVEWVIFDEVHYINDSERGVVWEEVLIMLPDHISIIMLSATVPNAMKFADWVGRTKKRKMFVITTPKRPVPLRHYLYTGNSKQTSTELFEIVSNKEIDKQSYSNAIRALKERSKKTATQFGPKTKHYVNPKQERSIWLSLIGALQKKEKLPIIAFTFSRKRCDGNADSLTTVDLLSTSSEKSEVHVYFEKAMMRLKGSDSKLPQISWMRDLLKRGIAVHHSGILPILKEVIELLFQRGLVRLLFATETFAMGVNMPARTVIFDSNRKHDGIQVRDLNPGEYIQMAGRAGRRGLDDDGTVILLCKADVPEMSDLKNMILGKPTSLESQFRLTYSMLLNLTRVETLKIKEMMRRSFAEIDSVQSQSKRIKELHKLEEEFASFSIQDDCPKCFPTITEYYHKCAQIKELRQKLQGIYFYSPQVMKSLQPGRVIIIYLCKYKYTAAVVLKNATQRLIVFLLCNEGDDDESFNQHLVEQTELELSQVQVFECLRHLHFPGPPLCHAVITIPLSFLVDVSDQVIKVDSSRIIDDYQKRQLPRFREDAPSSHCAMATQELSQFTEAFSSGYDMSKTMKIKDIEFNAALQEKLKLESSMESYECIQCPNFIEHFSIVREKSTVQKKISDLKFTLSEKSLQFLPEYKVRNSILKRLSFVSEQGTIELKGRVACELHSQEVLVTELLFQNILSGMEPSEIAALLSSVVFQQANCSEPNLCETLKKGKESIIQVAQTIFELEKKCGLYDIVPEEDIANVLKFGLVEVVYEWACGKEFVEIIKLTDVSEGMIVRCIQRLDETCKDVRNAARVIGDSILYNKMQIASTLIKRDIVFAASLYIQ